MYKEPDYARSRLNSTIVKHKGLAVQVQNVDEDMSCHVSKADGTAYEIHIDELDLRAPELGMVNYRGRASYISRRPLRRDWRQGVRRSQVRTLFGALEVSTRMLMDCVTGKFYTFPECIGKLYAEMGRWSSVAIDRQFCVKRRSGTSVNIIYKWYGTVATVNRDGTGLEVKGDYKHLEIKIKELLNVS